MSMSIKEVLAIVMCLMCLHNYSYSDFVLTLEDHNLYTYAALLWVKTSKVSTFCVD